MSVPIKRLVWQIAEARLNPCRWCGEAPAFEHDNLTWGCRDVYRVTCPRVDEPLYCEVTHDVCAPIEDTYRAMVQAMNLLIVRWNERNDGPGFFAGLA